MSKIEDKHLRKVHGNEFALTQKIIGKTRSLSKANLPRKSNQSCEVFIDYYHHFWKDDMRVVWNQLNARLLKWVKWEKDLYKTASVRYLKTKYKERPNLFANWLLVYP